MGGFAWVTLTTNDSYSLGALVLAHSLRRVGSKHDLVVLITPGVSQPMREKLTSVFTLVREVDVLDSKDEANLAVLQRPELGITFTKLHCWRLTQYDKCVFIDADALVVRNCDELFEREELSAAPDVGWPDCFNSGVFVFKPSEQTFNSLVEFAAVHGSFDGADQGLLNMYFSDWAHKDISKHLPFLYNMSSVATYSYAPAFNMYGQNVRIIHFIGGTKPWLQSFDTITGSAQPPANCGHVQPLLQTWWNIFQSNVQSELSQEMGGLAGALSQLAIGENRSEEQQAIEDQVRKQNWEEGQIDYMGKDSFDNILKKINETLESASLEQTSPDKETQQPKKSGSKDSEVEAAVEESEVVLSAKEEGAERCKSLVPSENEPTANKNEDLKIESSSATEVKEIDSTNVQPSGIETQDVVDKTKSVDHLQITDEVKETVLPSEVLAPTVLDIKQTEALQQNIDTELTQQVTEKTTEASINTTGSNLLESPEITNIQSASLDETVKQTETQNIPEAVTECPVPIQVAESVLQTEPKESVAVISDTPTESKQTNEEGKDLTSLVSDTTLKSSNSSIVSMAPEMTQQLDNQPQVAAPVQESDSVPEASKAVQETSSPLVDEIKPQPQMDLSVPEVNQCSVQTSEQSQQNVALTEKKTEPAIQDLPVSAMESAPEIQKPELTTEESTVFSESGDGSITGKPDESLSQKSKLTVTLPQPEVNDDHSSSEKQNLKTDPNSGVGDEKSEKKDLEMASSTGTDECLIKSDISKDAKVPGTPIITEATPPTSPPFELQADQVTQEKTQPESESQSQKEKETESPSTEQSKIQEAENTEQLKQQPEPLETAKPTIEKKSSLESDSVSSPESEGPSKKNKKNSKKGGKLSKEETEEKKLTETSSSTSLDTDKTVPETPPPSGAATSEGPVPPKRKTKNTPSAKTSSKKSD